MPSPAESEIETRRLDFKRLLLDDAHTDIEIVRSRLSSGTPFVFRDDPETYQSLRDELSNHFGIRSQETLMVGSGHLGFSLSPEKLWRSFYSESDLDMVVISASAFVDMWEKMNEYDRLPKALTNFEAANFRSFKKFHFRWRVVPNFLPVANRREWFDYFSSIYGTFAGRKITGTIFYNWHFFEQYHVNTIATIRAQMRIGEEVVPK
jgi:hypothetical protein